MLHLSNVTTFGLVVFFYLAVPSRMVSQAKSAGGTDAAQFVTSLLGRMTLSEKTLQLEQVAGQLAYTPPEKANQLARDGVGSFLFFTDPVRINELQHIAVTESRLHIPLLFGYDVIHGFRTIGPVPLAMASTWDPALVEDTQRMAALEATSAGIRLAFAPMVDVARDARWGRIMEGAGEDPFLGSSMAAAQVRGFQGPVVGTPGRMLASVKHFAGYGAAPAGRDYESVDLSEEELQNVYLPPFKAAIDVGAGVVMSAYMSLNGVPASANEWLMRDVLRNQWGFKGFVLSDWNAVENLKTQGLTADSADSALRAAEAGVNMEMTSSTYSQYLPELIRAGRFSETQLDALVRPILEMKFRLGLFDHPYASLADYQQQTLSTAQRTAVRLAAEQSAVLLRNENNLLPLPKSLHSLAIIGPLADSQLDTLGSWAIHADRRDTVTIAQGLREALPNTHITVNTGVEIQRGSRTIFDEQVVPNPIHLQTAEAKQKAFSDALNAAQQADTTILVLGEAQTMSGENASRARLTLPNDQQRLLEAIVALEKPVVLVLMTGRPLDITWASSRVPAILNIWYPGTEGGHAAARLLLGEANPGGHLPLTWPREAGQEPLFYNANAPHNPEEKTGRTWDLNSQPLYHFGFGLSYSRFTFSNLKVKEHDVANSGSLEVSVTVRNVSTVAGDQVVQLYTHQRAGKAARPVRELKAFQKVHLQPGESKEVNLLVLASSLAYWSQSTHGRTLDPGTFDVWVGDSSAAELHETFSILAQKSQTLPPE